MPLGENRPDIPDEQARWMRGEEDPLRVIRSDADEFGHPLQYAVTGHPHSVTVVGTGNATDEQIRAAITQALGPNQPWLPIERFNRCPTCEEWSPCSVRKAWRGKLPGLDDGSIEDAPRAAGMLGERVEVTAELDGPPPTDLLATARNAVGSIALDLERTGHHNVERLGVLAQSAALASIAESLAALLVPPGVVEGTQKFIQAATEALRAQTEAIRAIARSFEAAAHPQRIVYPSELLAVLDDPPTPSEVPMPDRLTEARKQYEMALIELGDFTPADGDVWPNGAWVRAEWHLMRAQALEGLNRLQARENDA